MDIRKLQRAIVDGLEDVKAQNIAVFNTEHLSSLFERVIIASGTSNRQTKALASSVRESVKSRGMQVMATEGEDNGEWIIVDCGAAVAHIMQPAIRDYYHLEEIWGGKNVRIKLGDAKTTLVKASEPDAPPARPARNAARQAAHPSAAPPAAKPAKPAAGRRAPVAQKAAAPAGRTGSGRKPAPSKAPVSATLVVKTRQAAPKAAPAKTAARKAPARKATAGKTVARKAPARKSARST
jgi:ribosome-associated protein